MYCCIAMTNYTNTYACVQNHNNNTIRTIDTVLRKIYLSVYLKGLYVRGSCRLNRTAKYWPPTLLAIIALLSRSPGLLNRGPHSSIFSPTRLIPNWLNFLCTELYNSLTSTFFLWASQIALIQLVHSQGYILIFLDRMHLLFTKVHFLFWQPSRVGS